MILLITSFVAGILTIFAPCTIALLPVMVGSSVGGEKPNLKKALTIATSLGVSIILFTLLLKASTALINIPPSVWSIISGTILLLFGIVTLAPSIWDKIPFIAKLNLNANKVLGVGYQKKNFWGDVIIGASLGPVFSTCSPTYFVILATVLPQSFSLGLIYLLAYTIGLGLMLLLIAFIGQKLANRLGVLSDSKGRFKKVLGVLFVAIGILIISGTDKVLERKLVNSGTFGSTKLEQKLLQLGDKSLSKTGNGLPAPEIVKPSGFINTDGKPITIREFKDNHVVLLDVWTYSCINCQRTIPYLNAWYEKYKDQGLVIIGLHTPEFAFEQVQKNVQSAVEGFDIKYPVVMDNDYATWNAYGNQYWPRKYLIGVDGDIVYDHIGEGDYADTERAIQKALIELHKKTGSTMIVPTDISNPNNAIGIDPQKVQSPETYFGASRNEYLGNGVAGKSGEQIFSLPPSLKENKLYLSGTWDMGTEQATSKSPGSIVYKYNAQNVYLVANSSLPKGTIVTIKRDGVFVKTITIKEDMLYTLVDDTSYGVHILEIEIPNAGLSAFAFTFG